jgi:hypothetical protein
LRLSRSQTLAHHLAHSPLDVGCSLLELRAPRFFEAGHARRQVVVCRRFAVLHLQLVGSCSKLALVPLEQLGLFDELRGQRVALVFELLNDVEVLFSSAESA